MYAKPHQVLQHNLASVRKHISCFLPCQFIMQADIRTEPNRTEPNQTKPNHTMTANSTNSSACISNMTEFHGGGSFTNTMPLNSGAIAVGIVLIVIAYTFVGLRIANSCRRELQLFVDDCKSYLCLKSRRATKTPCLQTCAQWHCFSPQHISYLR